MRTLCDVCESATAVLFCAADEAALCRSCDDKVHRCNKLANRHVRVGLADPNAVPRCDICENAPAFFYCEVDGSSLCLQCDMIVHVGGKRTHGRYLVLRQRIEFPGDKPGRMEDPNENRRRENQQLRLTMGENQQNHRVPESATNANADGHANTKTNMMDLNMQPHQIHEQASNNQYATLPDSISKEHLVLNTGIVNLEAWVPPGCLSNSFRISI
ncbi:hypothetical protein TEA_002109 [Camellia sinensis var. sinensis]|uniref:B box-type domain-containing protein n=1 Tax=Camellia sinensis var. sinensis TaxID=542762 RepID=A0A4S4DCQ4_CAMSN|nr:hypothetical protein TEA_002109 [Camellia sinensis var. sinensis]